MKIKRIISVLLIACMLIGIIPAFSIANAATYGDLTYSVSNGEATITDCKQSATSVTIPSEIEGYPVTSIGGSAFYFCTALESIKIGNGVTSIGDWAFYSCDALKSITIPDSVTSIGERAFFYCDALASITIGNSVTSIADEAFSWCSALVSIEIPDSVTSIGNYAFSYCDSLESITIGDSVTSIGDYAFRECSALKSITIGDSITSIGNSAFYYCTALKSIEIPDSVTSIGSNAFYNTALYNNEENWQDGVLYINNHLIKAKTDVSGDYTIKSGSLTVADEAFRSCSALKNITIGNSVTSIGDYAFLYCNALTSITIGDSVTSIGEGAFSGCSSLKSIEIPDSVTTIGDEAFYCCDSLESIKIDNGVTAISDSAFYICYALTEITVEENNQYYSSSDGVLYNIDKTTLVCCPGAKSGGFEIPDSVTSIGDSAFYSCESLVSIEIPDSVTSIGRSAFYGCSALVSIEVPDSVTSIGNSAFYFCDSLKSIEIPDSVTSIGNYAFSYCDSLESITIGDSVTSIGNSAFYYCTALKSITIGDSVTSIGERAFWVCYSLKSITIGDSVTSIGYEAFYSCESLVSIEIPDSVTSIGGRAFYDCSRLRTVYYIGSKQDKEKITIIGGNVPLNNATWHYCEHTFDSQSHFDKCTDCGEITNSKTHVFDDACDTTCNGCEYTRDTEHSWSEYVYNNDATKETDGTKTRTCESCGESETVVAEGTKLPSIIPDDRLPEVVLNQSGNGVAIDMKGSWATRVYWGYIGEEEIEYTSFDDFRIGCGTEYNADFTPREQETYNFTKKGYYRFVLKCIISGDNIENYKYKDRVFTFYYDGSAKSAVPYLKVIDGNTVQIEKNGLSVTKMYYGNVGQEFITYGWFNDFWGKALATKSYKVDFGVTYGEQYKLVTKGFYNFVIVYNDAEGISHEVVYTVEAKENIGIITAENSVATLMPDNTGGKVNKLYYGFIGDDASGVVDYDTLKQACGTLTGDWSMRTGKTYNLTQKGYYGFCVNHTIESFINGGFTNVTYDIIYIIENK